MNNAVSTQFDRMVPDGKLSQCIEYLEDGLRSLKRTPYHRVLGKGFEGCTNDLAEWINGFYQSAIAAKIRFKAVYLEMNGFAVNPSQWHCDIFGYKKAGDLLDLDWLAASDARRATCFVLNGMESVQKAFADLFLDERQPLGVKLAGEITEHLVTARFMQLVAAAHKVAKRRHPALKGVSIFSTAHDWDTAHRST